MNAIKRCPSCQELLPSDAPVAPGGLCPKCLIKAGLDTGVEVGPESRGDASRVPFAPPAPEELDRFFPQLEILELLGRGGMGAVYRARQKQLDRSVAVKVLPPCIGDDPAFAERFTREAKALAKLNHPNIVTLHEFGQADGLYYFIMEFVDGVNLRQLLHAGRIAPREALAIVPQICDALQYAHDQGIVHRDIKPENILIDRQGRVKVADFGLVKLVGMKEAPATATVAPPSETTEAGRVLGTPQYMAPEQSERPADVDHRADIYSLGVVFYQMLTGELPGKRLEPPSKKVVIDVRLDEVVLRALEKAPERRYQQASEMKTMVETAVMNLAAPKLGSGESDRDSRPMAAKGDRKAIAIKLVALLAAGVLVTGGLVAGGLALFRSGGRPANTPPPTATSLNRKGAAMTPTAVTKPTRAVLPNLRVMHWDNKGQNYNVNGHLEFQMECLGESKDYDYWFFGGVSGDAHTQVFSADTSKCCRYLSQIDFSPELARTWYDAVGYDVTVVTEEQFNADRPRYVRELMKYIDRGIPIIAKHSTGGGGGQMDGDYILLVGYEDGGGQLLFVDDSWFDQNAVKDPDRVPTNQHVGLYFILPGTKKQTPPLADAYRKAVLSIPELLTRPRKGNLYYGREAFETWADHLLAEDYVGKTDEEMDGWKLHGSYVCILATNGSMLDFLNRAAKLCPDLPFIADVAKEYAEMGRLWKVELDAAGGSFNITKQTLRNKAAKQPIAEVLRRCAACCDRIVEIYRKNGYGSGAGVGNVRVVYVPPMTIAASHAAGLNCEGMASKALNQFAMQSGLLKIKPDTRQFGFDCSGGKSGVGEASQGYEMWVSIPDGLNVPAPLIKRTFQGGLYAAHTIRMGEFDHWHVLREWVRTNGRYTHDLGSARWTPFEEGMDHCLEEQLNFVGNIQDPTFDNAEMRLDLLFPIKETAQVQQVSKAEKLTTANPGKESRPMNDDKTVDSKMSRWHPRRVTLPAFEVIGFTKIVASGGELYGEVRGDGRWEQLRRLGGDDPTIYGVASHDKESPQGKYRYTVGVKVTDALRANADKPDNLFSLRIRESDWLAFTINFKESFGQLWQDDPYKIIKQLGWEFNTNVNVHTDVFGPSYKTDGVDDFEFWMPVKRPQKEKAADPKESAFMNSAYPTDTIADPFASGEPPLLSNRIKKYRRIQPWENYFLASAICSVAEATGANGEALRTIGRERLNGGFHFFSAITGDMFSPLYADGKKPCDSGISNYFFMPQVVKEAYSAFGYECIYISNEQIKKDFRAVMNAIKASVDKGIPVLAWGVGNVPSRDGSHYDTFPEGSLIGGYGPDDLLYINLYPGPERMGVDADGYTAITNGLDSSKGLFFVGKPIQKPELREVYRKAIERIPAFLTRPPADGYVFGREAFEKWADTLLDEKRFAAKTDAELPIWDAHCSPFCNVLTSAGEAFVRAAAEEYDIPVAKKLLPLYVEYGRLRQEIWNLQGGFSPPADKFRTREFRIKIAEILRRLGGICDEISRSSN